MQSLITQYDSLTYIFTIPHVSKLLVYKDHWNESKIMRMVIAEILDQKLFAKLYLGSKHKKFNEQFFSDFEDCAIISIRINGLNALQNENQKTEEVFATELRNHKNVIHFDNTRLNLEKNVSLIDVSVKICESAKSNETSISAA